MQPKTNASRAGEESAAARSADEESTPTICDSCQRPITDETPAEWRGKPVHPTCGAELRCGVSLRGAEARER